MAYSRKIIAKNRNLRKRGVGHWGGTGETPEAGPADATATEDAETTSELPPELKSLEAQDPRRTVSRPAHGIAHREGLRFGLQQHQPIYPPTLKRDTRRVGSVSGGKKYRKSRATKKRKHTKKRR